MGQAAAARARRLYDATILVPAWERLLASAAVDPGVALDANSADLAERPGDL